MPESTPAPDPVRVLVFRQGQPAAEARIPNSLAGFKGVVFPDGAENSLGFHWIPKGYTGIRRGDGSGRIVRVPPGLCLIVDDDGHEKLLLPHRRLKSPVLDEEWVLVGPVILSRVSGEDHVDLTDADVALFEEW